MVQDALDRFELLMDAICRMRDVWVSEIEGDHLFDADGDDADDDDADTDESLNAIATAAAHAALASKQQPHCVRCTARLCCLSRRPHTALALPSRRES